MRQQNQLHLVVVVEVAMQVAEQPPQLPLELLIATAILPHIADLCIFIFSCYCSSASSREVLIATRDEVVSAHSASGRTTPVNSGSGRNTPVNATKKPAGRERGAFVIGAEDHVTLLLFIKKMVAESTSQLMSCLERISGNNTRVEMDEKIQKNEGEMDEEP
jgi:hypothetical protein